MTAPKAELYSGVDLEEIALTLGRQKLPPEIERDLQLAAGTYWFLANLDGQLPGVERLAPAAKKRKQALEKVSRYAEKLRSTLDDRAALWPIEGARLLGLLTTEQMRNIRALLDEINKTAKHDVGVGTGPGRPELGAREWFLKELVEIYERVTGDGPSLGYDSVKDVYVGQFYEFARAALKPVNPHAATGLGEAIFKLKRDS